MYGLSSEIDLGFLVGREVLQVVVGAFQVIVHFDSDVSLSIEGDCQVSGSTFGSGIDAGRQLLGLIGKSVTAASAINERHLELKFEDEVLRVLDDERGESFTITSPGNTIVV